MSVDKHCRYKIRNAMRAIRAFAGIVVLTLVFGKVNAQTLPVGNSILEETARRQQVTGRSNDQRSFMIRPLFAAKEGAFDSLLYPILSNGDIQPENRSPYKWRNGGVTFLPVQLRQQYN